MIIQMIYNAMITLIGVLTIRFDLLSPLLVAVCASVCIALIIIPGGESKTMRLTNLLCGSGSKHGVYDL